MSTQPVGPLADDRDPLLEALYERCAAALPRQIWLVAAASGEVAYRGEPARAALDLAESLGRRREARAVMSLAATRLRDGAGGREATHGLPGTTVVPRAAATAQDAALAIFLREQLSPELRDALVAPWIPVFGDPFVAANGQAGGEPAA